MQSHNWAWWATKSLLDHNEPIDVMLIGSSLVQRVINEGDATYLNKNVDAKIHRTSRALEDQLASFWHRPVRTWSYAVGGLHASDAAVVTKTLMRGESQPGAIVYGIAPRDLMNNLLAAPCTTETFKLMSHLADQSDIAFQSRTTNGEMIDYVVSSFLQKALPLYDYRGELSQVFRRRLKNDLGLVSDKLLADRKDNFQICERINMHMVPEECDGDWLVPPYNPALSGHEDIRTSYFCAYRPFRIKIYKAQKYFLESMFKTCSERGIQLVLVNMPLRADNFEVMEPGFYERYLNDLRSLTKRYHTALVDMNKTGSFCDADFSDQVHLTGAGAVKLVRLAAPELSQVLRKPAFAMNGNKAN
jgi:hypothetical protein